MRQTQKERLKELFTRQPEEWIPLPTILSMFISQYGARLKELRGEGMNILNKVEWQDGKKKSWFMYVAEKQKEFD